MSVEAKEWADEVNSKTQARKHEGRDDLCVGANLTSVIINDEVVTPELLALAVRDKEVYCSATSVEKKEQETVLSDKSDFPWMDLVNEAFDALNNGTLRHYNLKGKIITTGNPKCVSEHMAETCQQRTDISATQKEKFGKGLVAFQCRVFRDKPVVCRDGRLDHLRKTDTRHPMYCACCFGFENKDSSPSKFVLQEIGAVTVQLCDVYINGCYKGQHVGVTLEELSPHKGKCYLRKHELETFDMSMNDKKRSFRGFTFGKGKIATDMIVGVEGMKLLQSIKLSNGIPMSQRRRDGLWEVPLPSKHGLWQNWNESLVLDMKVRLWFFLVQNSPVVDEWTKLESVRRWPPMKGNGIPHLYLDQISLVGQCHGGTDGETSVENFSPGNEFVDFDRDATCGALVTANGSLEDKLQPGGVVIGLHETTRVYFQVGREKNRLIEVAVSKNDIALWQGDTLHHWGVKQSGDSISSLSLQCQMESTLHNKEKDPASEELACVHETFYDKFLETAKLLPEDEDSQLKKQEKILELKKTFEALIHASGGIGNARKRPTMSNEEKTNET